MSSTIRSAACLALAGLLVAACSGGATPTPASPATSAPPSAAPSATSTASPASVPTPTPLPSTDAQGAEYVVGVETAYLTQNFIETVVGDVTELRDGAVQFALTMNDARVTGTGTWDPASVDAYGGSLGPEWGPYRLENDGGAWEGTCSGGMWLEGEGMIGTCWLVGSGAHDGFTFYLFHYKVPGEAIGHVQGIIYPGAPLASS